VDKPLPWCKTLPTYYSELRDTLIITEAYAVHEKIGQTRVEKARIGRSRGASALAKEKYLQAGAHMRAKVYIHEQSHSGASCERIANYESQPAPHPQKARTNNMNGGGSDRISYRKKSLKGEKERDGLRHDRDPEWWDLYILLGGGIGLRPA